MQSSTFVVSPVLRTGLTTRAERGQNEGRAVLSWRCFIRTGDEEHVDPGLVFLISNDETGSKMMCLGKENLRSFLIPRWFRYMYIPKKSLKTDINFIFVWL
ncbi:hypothetical protein E5342_04210 [Parabacteroides distasonis]|uniref:Uncharacterized protein n=1 Tax=Parabacteroides distasonis TaxID=823 RepID=A0A4S2EYH1_PARDI|nr:hypothetical protein E5342_04210 [Parabacteroides distasonis]